MSDVVSGIRRSALATGVVATMLVLAACTSVPPSPPEAGSPSAGPPTADGSGPAIDYPAGSLPNFLAADGRFSTFLALMERDGVLLARLLGDPDRPFTLFLPADEAFGRLAPSARAALEADPSAVTGIVERHFLTRRLSAEEFATGYVFAGMSRRQSRLALVVDGDQVWFGDARVIETDLRVAGGILHVIDGVNLGPTPDRIPIP